MEDPTIKDAKLALRNMQDSWQKRNYYLNQLLDEVWAKSIDDLPESKLPELVKVLRSSIRDAKQIDRYENFVKSVRQDLTNKPKIPVKNAMDEYDIKFQTKDSVKNDLYEEAKKYKSADEFISSKNKVYHWTKAEWDVFDINKWFRQQYWNAFYWTLIRDKAKQYGNVKDIYLDNDIKIFNRSNTPTKKPYIFQDESISKHFKDNNLNSEEKIKYLKDRWYDWFIAWDEHVIFNTDKIKTESQLRNIREEANQKIPTKFQTKQWQSWIINKAEAESIVRKYFKPEELTVEFQKNILTPKWQEAFGKYYNKTISLIENPHKSTPEHEVAHAYFDMFTEPTKKQQILDQIKKDQGYKTNLDAEEHLADWFYEYIQGKKNLSISWRVLDYVKTVWNDVKRVFGKWDKVKGMYDDLIGWKRVKEQIPVKKDMFQVKNDWWKLMDEAKKYKSADEFINTRWKPFFHWTDKKFSKFKTPIEWDYGSEANFFSPTEQWADYYRRTDKWEVKKVFIDNDIKIRERDKEANQKDLIKYVEWLSDDDLKWWKEATIKWIKKGTYYIVQDPIIMKYMKNKWFGWFTNIDHTPNWLEETMWVFSPDKVKTESQLRKIREEANKQPKIPLKK